MNDEVVQWFWKCVRSWPPERKSRLLQFATGTSRIPVNGFKDLQGSDGPRRFTIEKSGDPSQLPKSHTCFNRIDLPPYKDYATLEQKLTLAVEYVVYIAASGPGLLTSTCFTGRPLVSARSKRRLAPSISFPPSPSSYCLSHPRFGLCPSLTFGMPGEIYLRLLSRSSHSPITYLCAPAGSRKEMYTYKRDTRSDHAMRVEVVERWLAWGLYISCSSFVSHSFVSIQVRLISL